MALLNVENLSVHFGDENAPLKRWIASVTRSMKVKY